GLKRLSLEPHQDRTDLGGIVRQGVPDLDRANPGVAVREWEEGRALIGLLATIGDARPAHSGVVATVERYEAAHCGAADEAEAAGGGVAAGVWGTADCLIGKRGLCIVLCADCAAQAHQLRVHHSFAFAAEVLRRTVGIDGTENGVGLITNAPRAED